MKLQSIRILNNPIFGKDFSLSFTDKNWQVMDTVILAGENGCGKTSVLEMIYEVLFPRDRGNNIKKMFPNEERYYTYTLNGEEEQEFITALQQTQYKNVKQLQDHQLTICNKNNITAVIVKHSEWELTTENYWWSINSFLQKYIKVTYSSVEVNYWANTTISGPTALDLDQQLQQTTVKSWPNLGQEITQLFVNISAFDNADLNRRVKENPGMTPPLEIIEKRQKRFSRAFDNILTHKKYKEVYNSDDGKVYEVHFDDHGKTVDINNLSSWEKQIVFRGGFLLKDKQSIQGSIVLIDEPEISLHPTWQIDIANFYKKLFTDELGKQTSQIFFSTHSPFIIHNDNRYEDVVIILKKEPDTGDIFQVKNWSNQFYSRSSEKLVQEAFDIDIFKSINKHTIFVEWITDKLYFEEAQKVFWFHHLDIEFRNVGSYDKNTHKSIWWWYSGLDKIKDVIKNNPWILPQHITLIYDCDAKRVNENHEKYSIIWLSVQDKASWDEGIENMLYLSDSIDISPFIFDHEVKQGRKTIIEQQLRKKELCDHILSLDTETKKKIFAHFETVLKHITSP